jgi:hypothetical protein
LLLDEFAYSLAQTAERVCNETFQSKYNGIIILIDEADNSSKHLDLGTFFKLLLERLQRRGCDKVMVGLAGLPDLRKVIATSHLSALRIFEDIPLNRLSPEEVKSVIDICIKRANDTNKDKTSVTEEAYELLVNLAEGYPHFIQQFGHSAFAADTDFVIDHDDVMGGAFSERGALEKIGDSYYRNDFYNKIQKDNYRQVLRIMAKQLDSGRVQVQGDAPSILRNST